MSITYCETTLPAHQAVMCNNYKKGGISGVGFLKRDHTITDFTSLTQLNAAIANGTLNIIKGIKGEIPDASPVEGENLKACGPDTITDSYDRMFNWEDGAVNEANADFYDTLNLWNDYLVIYNCTEKQLFVVQSEVAITSFYNVPKTKKEKQRFKATAKWDSFNGPEIYDASALTTLFE